MEKMNYDQEYYSEAYGDTFIQRQQDKFNDYINGKGGFEGRINFLLDFVREYLSEKNKKILDLGCGIGTFALLLAQQGFKTVGLDISANSIAACEDNKKKLKITNAQFVQGNVSDKIFANKCFDIIIASDIIEHLPPNVLTATLQNCHDWLKPGGSLFIHTFPTKYWYQTMTRLSLCLLPLLLSRGRHAETYLKFLHNTVFNLASLLIFKKTIHRYIAQHGHCNPPHPFRFRELLESANFQIIKYQLTRLPVSPVRRNFPKFKIIEEIIKKHKILSASIDVIAQK